MKILLTGAAGVVGSALKRAYPDMIPAPSLRHADIGKIRQLMDTVQPDVIVHTAAISDIGTCQKEPDASYQANVLLPCLLASACGPARLICFSSDQVYSGCQEQGPYTEDMACPANVYAMHKLEMENRVLDLRPDAVMLRAEWRYEMQSARSNYLKLILEGTGELVFSSRQYRGVTYLKEVAEAVPALTRLPGGVYNFGSETRKSIYKITRELVDFLQLHRTVTDGGNTQNLWMDCSRATGAGVRFSTVEDALRRAVMDWRDAFGT